MLEGFGDEKGGLANFDEGSGNNVPPYFHCGIFAGDNPLDTKICFLV
ncbi:hypothetical protein FACS1894110_20790 [Spirochaetia bacterium]|nr:hypothetical protein FACS1894110_20790 [Spirochaetia bacterium]